MRRRGKPLGFIALMCGIYTTARLGLAARVTDDIRTLLGRRPRKMRAFVEDHADDFRGDSRPNRSPTENDTEDRDVETRGPPVPDIAYDIIVDVTRTGGQVRRAVRRIEQSVSDLSGHVAYVSDWL